MIVANFTTHKPEMAHSRTYEDFSKFLGEKPERLGIVSRMKPYDKYTMSYLTEGIGNVFTKEKGKGSKWSQLQSLCFDWEIELRQIHYTYFAEPVVATGENGLEIPMLFNERYYEVDDTFIVDETKQMLVVIDGPIRKSDRCWEYTCKLMTNDSAARLNTDACYAGAKTRWIGNIKLEYHDRGFVKFQSNVEQARQWISEVRVDIDASARYEATEDIFIQLSRGSKENGWETKVFAWPDKKRVLMDNFQAAINQGMLWQRGTMDENGKSLVHDREGRPFIAGDGIIPLIMKYASKYNYATLTSNLLNEIILTMSKKCEDTTGNTFAFICNETLWFDIQQTMSEYLNNHKAEDSFIWSKQSNGYVKVGGTFNAYEFAGNTVEFAVDRALSIEFGSKGFGVLIDLTGDAASGRPAIEKYTLKGHQLLENTLTGVGIRNGEVATATSGVKYVMSGYWGVAVYNPYRSVVLLQN